MLHCLPSGTFYNIFILFTLISEEKGEYYEKEVIFSVWPSGRVIKTEEDPVVAIKAGILT